MVKLSNVFVLSEGPIQPNQKVEKLFDSPVLSQFSERDWLDLALSSLDQAGIPSSIVNKIQKMAEDSMPSLGDGQ